jgi:hypothetical protein
VKRESDCIIWSWEDQELRVGYDRLGVGRVVLLLPALSSICTRREMRPLQERLASDFATVAIDWPVLETSRARQTRGNLQLMRPFCATSLPMWLPIRSPR